MKIWATIKNPCIVSAVLVSLHWGASEFRPTAHASILGPQSLFDPKEVQSDDPADYPFAGHSAYRISVSEPQWVVPSPTLPKEIQTQLSERPSNNNVDFIFHHNVMYMAWRSAKWHFASEATRLFVVSSKDGGASWQHEHTVALGADIREPRFVVLDDTLYLYFFEGGKFILSFSPQSMWAIKKESHGKWSQKKSFGHEGEVPWNIKVRQNTALMTSYFGNTNTLHPDAGNVDVVLRKVALNGRDAKPGTAFPWNDARDQHIMFERGLSEVSFELAPNGDMVLLARNEDGTKDGFGSYTCVTPAGRIPSWKDCRFDPERYDSAAMFRHEDKFYVVARRDINPDVVPTYLANNPRLPMVQSDITGLSPLLQILPKSLQQAWIRYSYLISYSLRPKRTALFEVDTEKKQLFWLQDLPSNTSPSRGDTAFPAVRQIGPHSFLVANYTNPTALPEDVTWLRGQLSPHGTHIYLQRIDFK